MIAQRTEDLPSLTEEERRFLQALVDVGGKTTRRGLPGASSAQDRARQHAKKMGWVRYAEFARKEGHRRQDKQWGWVITAKGKRMLGTESTPCL